MKTQLIIIQPTPFCNINCRYCYLPDRANKKRMSMETLARIFTVFFSSSFASDKVTFVWHASEPLVLPSSFYEQAFRLQRSANRQGMQIVNAFQTNGTLITQAWCDFFKAHNVHIGVSLDGPQHIHDANRTDRSGRGTFERVMRGIRLLRTNNIDYSAIAVITAASVHHPDELWQFFSGLGLTQLGFNPEEVEGANAQSSLVQYPHTDQWHGESQMPPPAPPNGRYATRTMPKMSSGFALGNREAMHHYQRFIKRILTLQAQAQTALKIRDIDVLMRQITADTPYLRSQTITPMAILSFDCDGNISTFSPELLTMAHPAYGKFTFGDVFHNTLEDIASHPKFMAVHEQIQRGVARCQATCAYFAFCGGGHPSNKIYENGTFDSTETLACRLKVQAATDALLEHLEEKYYLDAPTTE